MNNTAVLILSRHEISRPLGLKGSALRGRYCHVEFILEHSPSVPVCSRLFSALLFYSSYYSVLLRPLLSHPCPYYVSVPSVLSFQPSTLGFDPSSVSSDLAFILFPLLFGYNPYQPNPIAQALVV